MQKIQIKKMQQELIHLLLLKKIDLAHLKSDVDKLGINKVENIPRDLISLRSKVDKLDVDKLVLVAVDLSKLSNLVENEVVKKDAYNAKIKNIEDKIPDITNLATKSALNAKINGAKSEIPSITNFATTTTILTAVENRIPNVKNLVKKVTLKLMKTKRKLLIMIRINVLLLHYLIS